MNEFLKQHSLTETFLCIIVGIIGIIAACQDEWATAGGCVTGAFAIMKGRPNQQKGDGNEKTDPNT